MIKDGFENDIDSYGKFDLGKHMHCVLGKIECYGCTMENSSKFKKFDAITLQEKCSSFHAFILKELHSLEMLMEA